MASGLFAAACKSSLQSALSVLSEVLRQDNHATGSDTQVCVHTSREHQLPPPLCLLSVRVRIYRFLDALQSQRHQDVGGTLLRTENIQLSYSLLATLQL